MSSDCALAKPRGGSVRSTSSCRTSCTCGDEAVPEANVAVVERMWDLLAKRDFAGVGACMSERGMMRRRYGRIVNIASISGVLGNPGQGNYAASKAGLVGMTKSLAREVSSRGITANCIAPGFIKTPMTDALTPKQVEAIAAAIPTQTFGKPEDIAAAVVLLASNEAAYITGETVHVNGGMVMV